MFVKLCLFINLVFQNSCHYFSTKTPYNFVGNKKVQPLFPNSFDVAYFRYLGRHGERFPSLKDLKIIHGFIKKFSDSSQNFQSLLNLSKLKLDPSKDKYLSPNGINQLFHIGRRYRERLSSVFDNKSIAFNQIFFKSTCRSRSVHSMISFIEGMFDLNEYTSQIPEIQTFPCDNDLMFRFFDFCETYSTMQSCFNMHVIEIEKFMTSQVMIDVTNNINKKLGLSGKKTLTPENIKGLYLLCVYDYGVNNITMDQGPCKVFDEEALVAFDYLFDIKAYFKRANAFSLNLNMGCQLFKDFYSSILSALNSCPRTCTSKLSCDTEFKADFGFAHAETGNFGFFGPVNSDLWLSAKNFHKLKDHRTFHGGFFSPMAGNIAFTVGCPQNGIEEGVVLALLNEHPIPLPCCWTHNLNNDPMFPVCTKKSFEKCFHSNAFGCNFDDICSGPYECPKIKL